MLLAIETAVAWRMLLVRWLARNIPEEPAGNVLNPTQLLILKEFFRKKKRNVMETVTAEYVLCGIAEFGGHIRNNGPPGWLVLRRGFEKLFLMEQGWELAQTGTHNSKDVINL